MSAALAIRSGVLTFDGKPLDADQAKALWAFIGAAIAASATVFAALVTRSHHERTEVLATQAERRLKLDTAVASLQVIRHEEGYGPPAVVAGGLATLIHLGHPGIAMRVLAAASRDGATDDWTTCWIIGQALTSGSDDKVMSPLLKVEASAMLLRKAGTLADVSSVGEVPWPDCLTAGWPRGLPDVAAANCIGALVAVVTARPRAWWYEGGKTWTWAVYSLVEATTDDSPEVRDMAARVALGFLQVVGPDEHIIGLVSSMTRRQAVDLADARLGAGSAATEPMLGRIRWWAGQMSRSTTTG